MTTAPATASRRPVATSAPERPDLRQVELSTAALGATPKRTLGMAILTIQSIRRFEKWLLDNADLVHGPLHSSIGQEGTATGTALALRPTDWLTSTHRAHHDVVAKLLLASTPEGFDPFSATVVTDAMVDPVQRTLAEIMGLESGLCHGRGGSMHLWDRDGGVMTSAIVGGAIPAAGGYALASKLRETGDVGVASFGDGAAQIGAFHETAALARAWDLPLILLLQNNQYSVATTVQETAGFTQLALRARGYDMPALVVDGMDPIAVLKAMERAREHAVSHGPILVEAATYRFYHQNGPLPGSAFKYRSKDEEREWKARDPAVAYPRGLVEAGLLSQDEVAHVQGLANAMIARCVAALTVEGTDGPEIPPELYPSLESTRHGMYGPGLPELPAKRLDETPAVDAEEVTYTAAMQGVIGRSLERDPEAFYLGEEVGHLGGGVAGLTRSALAVAPERVLSTPICENGFTGAAFGAALAGMHPIVEFMYPDFVLEAADQLFNHIGKSRYMFGGDHQVPVIVRTRISRGRGYGPQHSCDPAGLFTSFPGWRVVSPTTEGASGARRGRRHGRGLGLRRTACGRGGVGTGWARHRGRDHRSALARSRQLRPRDRAGIGGPDLQPGHRRGRATHAFDGCSDPRLPLPRPARPAADGPTARDRAGCLLSGVQAPRGVRVPPGHRHRGRHRRDRPGIPSQHA